MKPKVIMDMVNITKELADLMSQNLLTQPLIFHHAIDTWPALKWTPASLPNVLHDGRLKFRIGSKMVNKVQRELDCQHVMADIRDFLAWLQSCDGDVAVREDQVTLSSYSQNEYWMYADYNHMNALFNENVLKKDVNWSNFGLDKTGRDSTFWLGSEGAYTPCHYDMYGYNLVAQIYGRKRWRLFAPEDSRCLYPTRIPFEESSIYSRVNIRHPEYHKYPNFKNVRCYDVTLMPGDVLYVPRHWWHFVESLETSISINCWVDTPLDDEGRSHESIAVFLMCGMMSSRAEEDMHEDAKWLNPSQEWTSMNDCMTYVNGALSKVLENGGNDPSPGRHGDHDDVTVATEGGIMTSCHCRACAIFQRLREVNRNSISVEHIHATVPDVTDVDFSTAVSMETNPLSFNDFMTCVTQPDVIKLIADHLKEYARTKTS